MIRAHHRRLFDEMLDEQVADLPEHLHELLDQVPLVVEDEPSAEVLQSLDIEPDGDLLGLHDGRPLTEPATPETPAELPDRMMLFRGPIVRFAQAQAEDEGAEFEDVLYEQIHITLLHEIGHHFGLDEDDLDNLGYG